ncbi:MAG: hypothetical protein FWE37_07035 [Spirochaetaceae bacterium]|nr:hypothetical protein [Spirochaetaceae bacterium]
MNFPSNIIINGDCPTVELGAWVATNPQNTVIALYDGEYFWFKTKKGES